MIKELKNHALEEKIPIMQDEGIDYLTTFIIKHQIETVLEIGTAVGYSSIMMCLSNPKVKVVTIERDEERYMEALKNIKEFNLEDRITPIYKDALDVKLKEKFDLIFLDGAKGQNINFMEHFENNLAEDGYFITDNINFHGYVDKSEDEIKSKNLRGLVRKIKAYKEYLKENEYYDTKFLNIGDGIAVTQRKKEK
jgi:predicted O-methyltransferase YrrM